MLTFEQFVAAEGENVRVGLERELAEVIPEQLADARRVRVRVSSGGKVLRTQAAGVLSEERVHQHAERVRAELADLEGTLRRMYAAECWLKARGAVSLV